MAITLTAARNLTLRFTGEPEAESNSWYDAASSQPYAIIDQAIAQAEQDVGQELMISGCEDSLVVKSTSITFPASQEDVAWTTLDTTGVLPGSKIVSIEDTTTSLPTYIKFQPFTRKDKYDPASIYQSPRYRELRANISDVAAMLYKGHMSVYPQFSSARTLTIYYIPAFGRMNGIASITVTSGGSGYATAPTVTITDAGGSGATATATIGGGAVTAVTVGAAGTNYGIEATPAITFSAGAATATATVGIDSVLPDEARYALSYRAASILLAQQGRDESQMRGMFLESMKQLVNALQADRVAYFSRRRPRYQGIIP